MRQIAPWRAGPILLLSLLALLACSEDQAPVSAAPPHPWIKAPQVADPQSVTLPAWLVYRVDAKVMAEAVAELKHEPYIQISPSMASHYVQSDVTVPMEMRPFLVRALDAGHSEISVVQSLQGLWTRTIGGDGSPPQAQPLVVLLDPTPVDIFVTVEASPPPKNGG